MLNYLKSEFYRVFHERMVYEFTGMLSGLTVLLNIILYVFSSSEQNFPYGSIWFSLNNLSAYMQILLLGGMMAASFLFSDEYHNGTLKNTVSFGISRTQFFTAKCIVCTAASFFCMIVILTFYIGSAYLLLEGARDVTVLMRLKGVAANLPAAAAAAVLTVALRCVFKKDGIAVVWWMCIMWGIPAFCYYIGLQIDWLNKVAKWMPWNYLKYEVQVNMSQYSCLWDTPEGLAKCLSAGVLGIVIFYLAGIISFRRKEIA